ncbi:B3 domain-containing transcription factor VRN1-like [Corylus avellana]|uniref:B3 domain-containing transcription factor VRN1-like n=1 Tax=Corylus avellana TaxID=13451 RepID=UPI001E1FC77B|nr:B3 domain-containing transcription factor VRN1-like [Corylus avellana]
MAAKKSRTRRTRVVPDRSYDHRPSSSMAGRRPSHFFKVILPSTIRDRKLRIPVKFVMEFGDELSAVATLTDHYGNFWQVGLEKANNGIWFDDGWQDFMEYHSIHYGYFVVFRYEGNSKFHVLVFDNTATEIPSTWSKDGELEDPVDVMESDDAKKSRHDKLKQENEMSDPDKLSAKHEVDRGRYSRERFSGTSSKGRVLMPTRRERAIEAARMLNPESPSFMAFAGKKNIGGIRSLYVPCGFAKKYLIGHESVELQTSDGKHWHAWCRNKCSSPNARSIGWAQFCRDNNLEGGDVCVFELIKRNPVVLKVSIFHLADYAVKQHV